MTSRTLIVCKSVHHGNTRQIADRLAAVFETDVAEPESTTFPVGDESLLLGIGSGIYYARFHRSIRKWLKQLPDNAGQGHKAFVFSTSGLPFLARAYHAPMRRSLTRKGFDVIGDFSCQGHDTFTFLWLIGGLNRKHPNQADLQRAEAFAAQLLANAPASTDPVG